MGKTKALIELIYHNLLPHFVTEDVAVRWTHDRNIFQVIAPMRRMQGRRDYDAIATVSSFVFLGFGFNGTFFNFRCRRTMRKIVFSGGENV